MDRQNGIDQFKYLWKNLATGDLSEGYRLRLNGTLSEYAPLRPGITPLTIHPGDWDNVVSHNIESSIKFISENIKNSANKLKIAYPNELRDLDPEKLTHEKRIPASEAWRFPGME